MGKRKHGVGDGDGAKKKHGYFSTVRTCSVSGSTVQIALNQHMTEDWAAVPNRNVVISRSSLYISCACRMQRHRSPLTPGASSYHAWVARSHKQHEKLQISSQRYQKKFPIVFAGYNYCLFTMQGFNTDNACHSQLLLLICSSTRS